VYHPAKSNTSVGVLVPYMYPSSTMNGRFRYLVPVHTGAENCGIIVPSSFHVPNMPVCAPAVVAKLPVV